MNETEASGSLPFVRRQLVALLIVLLAACAWGQRRTGTYQKVDWSINDHHTLIWGGSPYLPAGVLIDGTPAAVEQAAAAKVKDLLVDLPAGGSGWNEALTALEAHQSRYLIRINSLAPMASGFAIEPQGYRISGIDTPRTITVKLPGAVSALVILATRRDGTVSSKERVPVIDGKLVYQAKPGPKIEHVLLIYPEMTSAEQPDYWEGFDAHRDSLLATLKKQPLGPGLRGIVNPMGQALSLPGERPDFVPTSGLFRLELRNYLEQKYKSVQTLTRSWAIVGSDLQTFEAVSRLVPLWNGDRGLSSLLDPKTNIIYQSDRRYSTIWTDIQAVISAAGALRYSRLIDSIRSVADVPVIQEWNGWALPYETSAPTLDGIGMRSSGTIPSVVIESACRATSSVSRWKTPGWLIATDIDLGAKDDAADVAPVVGDLSDLGARGFFVRSNKPAVEAAIARITPDPAIAETSPLAVFYPENATNPANPQRLTNGNWWLPTPTSGNRIDLGSLFFGYRADAATVIWAKEPGRYKLNMKEPKKAVFATVDGTDPKPKFSKDGVEIALTEMPLLITGTDEVPIPELAYKETVRQFEDMMTVAQDQHKDITIERLNFQDHVKGFEDNPSANFPLMRMDTYQLSFQVSDFLWIEAEKAKDTNFSEIDNIPGASGQGALVLDTKIDSDTGYYAEYSIPILTEAQQEVWIAARVPEERRKDIQIMIGDQTLPFPKDYAALYGQGLAWYKIGNTVLKGSLSKLRIVVSSSGTPIAFDTILISPIPFTPSATSPPMPVISLPSK